MGLTRQERQANKMAQEKTYRIVRFTFGETKEIKETGLSLEDAQAHCQDEATHGPGWFDGYEAE